MRKKKTMYVELVKSSDMSVQAGKHSQNKALQNVIPPGVTLIFRMADLPAAPLVSPFGYVI